MGRVISPTSEEGKELLKWEMHDAHWNGEVFKAGNPFVFREYPKMLYRAVKRDNGKVMCMEAAPNPYHYQRAEEYQRAELLSEQFNKSCQKRVEDASQEQIAKGQGWCLSAVEAVEAFEKQEQAIGDAAAEAIYAAKRMSDRAQAEFAAADASSSQHVTDLKAVKRKPGRPKAVVAVEEQD